MLTCLTIAVSWVTTYDGEPAASAFASFQPDFVLLDIGMRKRDGYEAANEIRRIVQLSRWSRWPSGDKRAT